MQYLRFVFGLVLLIASSSQPLLAADWATIDLKNSGPELVSACGSDASTLAQAAIDSVMNGGDSMDLPLGVSWSRVQMYRNGTGLGQNRCYTCPYQHDRLMICCNCPVAKSACPSGSDEQCRMQQCDDESNGNQTSAVE